MGVLPVIRSDVVARLLREAGWDEVVAPAGVAVVDPEGDSHLVDADNEAGAAGLLLFTRGSEGVPPPPLERLEVLDNSGQNSQVFSSFSSGLALPRLIVELQDTGVPRQGPNMRFTS